MDTKTLVVGQKVWVFGCGWFEATVVRLLPSGVEVKSEWGQLAQFDKEGNETEDGRYRRVGGTATMPPEWGPWELRERDREAEKAQEAKAKEAHDAWCERMFSTFYPRPK